MFLQILSLFFSLSNPIHSVISRYGHYHIILPILRLSVVSLNHPYIYCVKVVNLVHKPFSFICAWEQQSISCAIQLTHLYLQQPKLLTTEASLLLVELLWSNIKRKLLIFVLNKQYKINGSFGAWKKICTLFEGNLIVWGSFNFFLLVATLEFLQIFVYVWGFLLSNLSPVKESGKELKIS